MGMPPFIERWHFYKKLQLHKQRIISANTTNRIVVDAFFVYNERSKQKGGTVCG